MKKTSMLKATMKKLLLFFTTFSSITSLHAMDTENLQKKYQAPPNLQAILDTAQEQDEIFRQCLKNIEKIGVCKCPRNLPCYIKHKNIMQRLKNLDRLQTLFDQENLDELMLPKKYLWQDYLVAEELVPSQANDTAHNLKGITKKQLSQLIIMAQKGGFSDFIGGQFPFGGTNVYFSEDRPGKEFWQFNFKSILNWFFPNNRKKIAIIDTKLFNFKESHPNLSDVWTLTLDGQGDCYFWDEFRQDIFNDLHLKNFDKFWNKWEHCLNGKII